VNGQVLPAGFKWGYLAFVVVLVPVYTVHHGPVNFLWFSNVALLGGLVAAWLESRRLASMLLVSVLILEMGWIADFFASLVLGGRPTPLGLVGYMFDPSIPPFVRGLSLYHLPMPFVLFWMVWRLGYEPAAWRWWLPAGYAIVVLTYLLNPPDRNINWVMGPGGEDQALVHPWAWLAVLMAGLTLAWWLTHRLVAAVLPRLRARGSAD
jgi:hypothetical protein